VANETEVYVPYINDVGVQLSIKVSRAYADTLEWNGFRPEGEDDYLFIPDQTLMDDDPWAGYDDDENHVHHKLGYDGPIHEVQPFDMLRLNGFSPVGAGGSTPKNSRTSGGITSTTKKERLVPKEQELKKLEKPSSTPVKGGIKSARKHRGRRNAASSEAKSLTKSTSTPTQPEAPTRN